MEMVETDREPQDLEELDEESEDDDLDADDELDIEEFEADAAEAEDEDEDEDEDEEAQANADDEDESGSASLDELLAQRTAARRGTDDSDEDDIMSLTEEDDGADEAEALVTPILPIREQQEFVCNRCRLVKLKSQLADAQRGLCRDCV